jgi:hypothetical protein
MAFTLSVKHAAKPRLPRAPNCWTSIPTDVAAIRGERRVILALTYSYGDDRLVGLPGWA